MIYNSNSPKTIFKILFEKYSDKVESWWPTTVKDKKNIDFEIIVGVILTQNTNWNNVVKSLNNLNKRNMINIEAIKNSPINEIQELIKPSGFFRQKAVYLKNICFFFEKNKIDAIKQMDLEKARKLLLQVKGIGKESADSILLYALKRPVFVIDAYTKRIVKRLDMLDCNDQNKEQDYDILKNYFQNHLEKNVDLFRQYHGLIVEHAKEHCRKKPLCKDCVLKNRCRFIKFN